MSTNNLQSSAIALFETTAVTWTDDDGTTYRRTIEDGEIVDTEVRR